LHHLETLDDGDLERLAGPHLEPLKAGHAAERAFQLALKMDLKLAKQLMKMR
jgi:hypothetical protein